MVFTARKILIIAGKTVKTALFFFSYKRFLTKTLSQFELYVYCLKFILNYKLSLLSKQCRCVPNVKESICTLLPQYKVEIQSYEYSVRVCVGAQNTSLEDLL